MSSNEISIILDNPSGIYAPGSVLTGSVIVLLTKPKKSRRITIHAYGHAKTGFTKTHYHESKNEQYHYSCKKSYLDFCTPVWKPSNGAEKEELQPGRHCFNFTIGIPWNCLPNFEGRFGHIRYNIKAEMHVSWSFNLTCEKRFTVLSIMEPTIYNQQPVKGFLTQNNTFSSTKFVKAEITLPKKIYACGEQITVSVVVDNHSGTSIESIETGIQTEACYTGETSFSVCSKRKTEHECFHSFCKTESIPDGGHDLFRRTFTISKQLPTIADCPIIVVKHFVYVKINKKGIFSSTVMQTIPIILTTASLEPIQLPSKIVIPSAPNYNEEQPMVNSILGMSINSSSTRDIRSNSNTLYPSTSSDFHPSSVPNDFALMETYGAPPAYNELDTASISSSNPNPSAPPEYEETFVQKF
uniref:Arrestin C-terminal-like domain-containing protein n=1 Tax=Panagrolaimus davidi TaxID=227884 RepID=A0A914PMQ1_9BILA